jgi:hypothetical protein
VPAPERERTAYLYPQGAFDAIGAFDPVDLERWVRAGGQGTAGLVF